MFGDDNLFEKLVRDGEAVEADENKNVDEAVRGELPNYDYDTSDEELSRIYTMADELYVNASDEDKDYLQKVMDEIMLFTNQHERDKELDAMELGRPTGESKTNEKARTKEGIKQEIKDTKRDLLDIANTRLGWAVAEQLKTILDNPTKEGIEDGELNSNAVKLIYDFLRSKPDKLSLEAKAAIEDWVEEGWGDPDVLGGYEPTESVTNEEMVDEKQEPFTKEEIQQEIQNLEDKILNDGGGRTADRQTEVTNQREDEIERLEKMLADAPSEAEVDAASENKNEEKDMVDTISNDPGFENLVEAFRREGATPDTEDKPKRIAVFTSSISDEKQAELYPDLNMVPPRDSNWYEYAELHDFNMLELDKIAKKMGFDNWYDMDMSISPESLEDRDPGKLDAVGSEVAGEGEPRESISDEKVEEDLFDEPEFPVGARKEDAQGFLDASTLRQLVDAWQLIGSQDADSNVRTMADNKEAEYQNLLDAAEENEPSPNEIEDVGPGRESISDEKVEEQLAPSSDSLLYVSRSSFGEDTWDLFKTSEGSNRFIQMFTFVDEESAAAAGRSIADIIGGEFREEDPRVDSKSHMESVEDVNEEAKSTLMKATDAQLKQAMTDLNKHQHLSSAITTSMDAIASEIARRDREKDEDG